MMKFKLYRKKNVMLVKYKIIPIQDETWKETLLMYQKVKIINKKYAECNVSPHDGNDVLMLRVYQQSSTCLS